MVAPYELGDPIRSYVRVPGSGTDKAARPLCCDLSRVSLLAAAAPIPPSHVQDTQPSANEQPEAGQAMGTGVDTKQDLKARLKNLEVKHGLEGNNQATSPPNHEALSNDQNRENDCTVNPRKRSCREEAEATEDGSGDTSSTCPKRARVTPRENDGGRDRSISSVGINTAGCGSQTPSVGTQTNEPMNDVVRERNQLREQNIVLERRLAVFRDLFRDRERLIRLLRAVEVPS